MSLFPAYDEDSNDVTRSHSLNPSKIESDIYSSFPVGSAQYLYETCKQDERSQIPKRQRSVSPEILSRRKRSRSRKDSEKRFKSPNFKSDKGFQRHNSSKNKKIREKKFLIKSKESRNSFKRAKETDFRSKEERVAQLSQNKTFLEEVGVSPSFAFRLDVRGSSENIKLREIRFCHQSKYKCSAFFRRYECKEYRKIPRYFSFFKEKHSGKALPCFPLYKTSEAFYNSFISFKRTRNEDYETQSSVHNPLGILDSSTLSYISSSSSKTNSQINTSKIDKSSELGESELDDFFELKNKEFNKRLRENPQDVDLWLQFVEYQDESLSLLSFGPSDKVGRKKSSGTLIRNKAIIEKKLSVLKAASDKNPKNIPLAVKRLELSKEILDIETLDRQWKELLFLFPNNLELWKYYLNFKSSHFTSFSVHSTMKVFKSCFVKMKSLAEKVERPSNLENCLLDIFINLTSFLLRSGYGERGLALLQAIIEFNFFAPSSLPGSFSLEDRLRVFETFWSSESPRFGEENARGWNFTHSKKNYPSSSSSPETSELEKTKTKDKEETEMNEESLISQTTTESNNNNNNKSTLWLSVESCREKRDWAPLRNIDDADDPDRFVSFDDLSPFLFSFKEPSVRKRLLIYFSSEVSGRHYFEGSDSVKTPSRFACSDTFSVSSFVTWLPELSHPLTSELKGPYVKFIRRAFEQLSYILKKDEKRLVFKIWLLWESETSNQNPKSLKGLIQRIIATEPEALELYLIYADYLYKVQGYDSASKIIKVSLSNCTKFERSLFKRAIEFELKELRVVRSNERKKVILWMLSLFSLQSPWRVAPKSTGDVLSRSIESKTQITRSFTLDVEGEKAEFEEVSDKRTDEFFALTYLTYFTEGFESTVQLFKVIDSKNYGTSISIRRTMLDFYIWSSFNHSSGTSRAKVLLASLLETNPSSPYFIQVLETLETQVNVVSSLWRRVYSLATSRNCTSLTLLIKILQILLHRFIRNDDKDDPSLSFRDLNKAYNFLDFLLVNNEHARKTPILWRLYLWTFASRKRHQSSSSDSFNKEILTIFYRSMQDCPQSKVLYLDIIRLFGQKAEREEKDPHKGIVDLMNEKEIRIRCPIEELDLLLEPEMTE